MVGVAGRSFARRLISIVGAGSAGPPVLAQAREVGRLLALQGFGVVTGGLAGVMEAACQGAAEAGGLTVGILPFAERLHANPFCQVVLPTGLGQARNVLVVMAGEGVIAIGGSFGTLSELGHALKLGRPVVGLGTWQIPELPQAATAQEAVERLLGLLPGSGTATPN